MTEAYEGTHLPGLDGTNPLGFFAALGVQVLFADEPDQPKLWWSNDVVPHAIVSESCSVEKIVDQAMAVFPKWAQSPALAPKLGTKAEKEKAKFSDDAAREYLLSSVGQIGSEFATALIAEGSYDNNNVAKPSDLYFTAGQQKFLSMAQEILTSATEDDMAEGLLGPWPYQSNKDSLMWDIVDDRVYALSASNPSTTTKYTNPGPEALAILGFSRHPVFSRQDGKRTLTLGCSGGWKQGKYTWPLWTRPAGFGTVVALLAQATSLTPENRSDFYPSWGISQILQSQILRSDQGGYGTFSPPQIIWRTANSK